MKICVRVHDFGKSDALTLATKTKEMGFDGVQLAINKAIEGQSANPGTLNKQLCQEISKAFNDLDLEIAMVGAYFNPVHSDKAKVDNLSLKYIEHLDFARDLSTSYIGTETGSYNDDSWTYNPLNITDDALNEVIKVFKPLALHAKNVGVNMAIEGAYGHCMFEPKQLKRLIDAIDNNHVKVIVDVFNYLNINNHEDHVNIFEECLKLFKDKIVIFHLKDYIIENDKIKQVGLGQGLMNYKHLIPSMQECAPNAYLIFEGVMPVDMKSSLDYIKNLLK